MSYTITNRCIQCDSCLPECPTDAIKLIDGKDFWIDPNLCNNCEGYYEQPQCLTVCPVGSPIPFQAKKGRCKTNPRIATSPDLFADGKASPFASAIAIWELCNVLAQRQSLPWKTDDQGKLFYERQVNQGYGCITFYLTDSPDAEPTALDGAEALAAIKTFDVRSACLHLIYAAYAASLNCPWHEEFVVDDRQIESYLSLDKRKDLSKPAKLALIKDLVEQPCKILVQIHWHQQGKVTGFKIAPERLWHLLETQYHFQEDELGCKHLIGLTFKLRAGLWSKYFLNQQEYKNRTAFYQYGTLPKSLLSQIMSIWQQHEGAARMMLWLLFKAKMGKEQRIMVSTLMRVAYGEHKLAQISAQREGRKRLLRTFENDLEVLNHYGIKPIFDPITYPAEIQPLWAKLADLPDDAEEALDFWINDGSRNARLTDAAPRGKWNRLMNARLLHFDLPEDWRKNSPGKSGAKQRRKNHRKITKSHLVFSGQKVTEARKMHHLSQRALAEQMGKSQSWVRDIESGRFQPTPKDRALLCKLLCIEGE